MGSACKIETTVRYGIAIGEWHARKVHVSSRQWPTSLSITNSVVHPLQYIKTLTRTDICWC